MSVSTATAWGFPHTDLSAHYVSGANLSTMTTTTAANLPPQAGTYTPSTFYPGGAASIPVAPALLPAPLPSSAWGSTALPAPPTVQYGSPLSVSFLPSPNAFLPQPNSYVHFPSSFPPLQASNGALVPARQSYPGIDDVSLYSAGYGGTSTYRPWAAAAAWSPAASFANTGVRLPSFGSVPAVQYAPYNPFASSAQRSAIYGSPNVPLGNPYPAYPPYNPSAFPPPTPSLAGTSPYASAMTPFPASPFPPTFNLPSVPFGAFSSFASSLPPTPAYPSIAQTSYAMTPMTLPSAVPSVWPSTLSSNPPSFPNFSTMYSPSMPIPISPDSSLVRSLGLGFGIHAPQGFRPAWSPSGPYAPISTSYAPFGSYIPTPSPQWASYGGGFPPVTPTMSGCPQGGCSAPVPGAPLKPAPAFGFTSPLYRPPESGGTPAQPSFYATSTPRGSVANGLTVMGPVATPSKVLSGPGSDRFEERRRLPSDFIPEDADSPPQYRTSRAPSSTASAPPRE
jgi:hypothetical protein